MLGTELCRVLAGHFDIYGTDARVGARPERIKFIRSDITKMAAIARAIKKAAPGFVIHTAAFTDVDGCELNAKKAYLVNASGAENVALACRKAGCILIYISTDFVYDGKKDKPYREGDKTNPLNVYGKSKLDGEKAVRRLLKRYFIIRTSWLYGRNGKNFVDTIIAKARTEKTLKVVSDQVGSPTYTKDLAGAIKKLLMENEKNGIQDYGIYHVSNAGSVSWYEYAKEILRLVGSKTKVSPITSKELARPAIRPAMSVLDNTRFNNLTKYRMRDWNSALSDYLD